MRTHDSNNNPAQQPERFDEMTGGYDDVDHARAAKRLNADLRAMDATPRAKRTPGGWYVEGTNPPIVYANNGLNVIAQFDSCGESDKATEKANAELCAAAPDLLAVCRSLHIDVNGAHCTLRATSIEYRNSAVCKLLNELIRLNAEAIARATR
jgi:hypothetical protein